MNILSLQSHVAYGHVGNSAAVFALQRLGIEVWPIHTVQFSNHTGYGAWRGRAFDAGLIEELVQGIDERGVLGTCDGVLSGYMGSAGIGAAILDAVARVKSANPRARYCCDPVIGDVGRGVFVQPDIAEFMRLHAVPAADVVTPNHFELDNLTGRTTRDWAEVAAAVDALRALGPRTVLVTSLVTNETPADAIDLVACDDSGRYRVRTPQAADLGQWRRRRHCGAVFRPLSAIGLRRRGAVARSLFDFRHPAPHRRGGLARDCIDRRAG